MSGIVSNGHVLQRREENENVPDDFFWECVDCGLQGHSVEDVAGVECRENDRTTSKDVAWDTIIHMSENYNSFKIEDIKEEYNGIPWGTSRRTLYRTLDAAVALGVLTKESRYWVVEF